jgi:predicted phage terminase large subunit-like protein
MKRSAAATVDPEVREISAQPGAQTAFLASPADICIGGGEAGGGKSFALLLEALRHVNVPGFGAVVFRREFPEIKRQGGIWDQSLDLYSGTGAVPRSGESLDWTWPSGARVSFSHMSHTNDRYTWKGAQIPLILWDQLETFAEEQFWYLLSRNRSMCGVSPYQRGTCNPVPEDDSTGGWLHRLLQWWINPTTGLAIPERSGVIRWFVRTEAGEVDWADTREELTSRHPTSEPKSLSFVHMPLHENRALLSINPGYVANLKALDFVERERLLGGNWNVKPAAGLIFNRAWFQLVDAAPAEGRDCRGWDKAGGEDQKSDRSAGVRLRRVDLRDEQGKVTGTQFYITDALATRSLGPEREALIAQVASTDGRSVRIHLEQEPGSGGKDSARSTISRLAGFHVTAEVATGPKTARWAPVGAQALAGNFFIVRGDWNEDFLRELHNADGSNKTHDDYCDALERAFRALTLGLPSTHLQFGVARSAPRAPLPYSEVVKQIVASNAARRGRR